MPLPREERRCPVCWDHGPYVLWIENFPPEACAYDESYTNGGKRTIMSVTECRYQMKRAKQQAEWRKNFPDQFDQNGNIKPGGLVYILERLPPGTVLV